MKKKTIFLVIAFLALALTSGTFAYTFTSNSTLLDGYIADAPMVTYYLSANQPNWQSIFPQNRYGTLRLLPNGPGDETGISSQYPDSGEHWDKVGEPSVDDSTYVSTAHSTQWERDLYSLDDPSDINGSETINGITVFFRVSSGEPGNIQSGEKGRHEGQAKARAAIKTGSQVFEGSEETAPPEGLADLSFRWLNNPATGEAWTWSDIYNLQAGVGLRGRGLQQPAVCTRVYIIVDYSFVNTGGEVPVGDLFDIVPHPDYTGDLLVSLYLVNTPALLKAYQYLNLKINVPDSTEGSGVPHYRILSTENGVVTFNIDGGSALQYKVMVTGGGYQLISDDPATWEPGWSIVPELYCEVTQK